MFRNLLCLSCLFLGTYTQAAPNGSYFLQSGLLPITMPDLEYMKLETPQIIKLFGYPTMSYNVTTADGYSLTIHRITGSPKAPSVSGDKKPVLVMHGLAMASDSFVGTGPERGLGFQLADKGYDVWLGNARNTMYTNSNTNISPEADHSSFHEMGIFDLPAIIDFILTTTEQKQLYYVGYSMGTTSFFVLASSKPEYNAKIKLMVALAPAVYTDIQNSFIKVLCLIVPIAPLPRLTRRTEFAVGTIYNTCSRGQPLEGLCRYVYLLISGFNNRELSRDLMPLYGSLALAGTSKNTLLHYCQNFQKDRFQPLDSFNTGSTVQDLPEYKLQLVTTPVAVLYSLNDGMIKPRGVQKLISKLPNVVKTIPLSDIYASHTDIIFSIDDTKIVNAEVINLLASYP